MDGDERVAGPDLRRERRVIAAVIVAVLALVTLGYLMTHHEAVDPPVPAPLTAYARISDTRLAVEYQAADGQGTVSVTADETSTTVTLHVLITPFDPPGGGISPIGPVTSTIDLASPLGDRKVVDPTGTAVPQKTRDELGV